MRPILLFFCCLLPFVLNAQSGDEPDKITRPPHRDCEASKGFIDFDTIPTLKYPGGYGQYLIDSLQYPEQAITNEWEGKVTVLVHIDPTGTPSKIELSRGSGYGVLDSAALSAVHTMKEWNPAIYQGKPIKSAVAIPITFSWEEYLKNQEGNRLGD